MGLNADGAAAATTSYSRAEQRFQQSQDACTPRAQQTPRPQSARAGEWTPQDSQRATTRSSTAPFIASPRVSRLSDPRSGSASDIALAEAMRAVRGTRVVASRPHSASASCRDVDWIHPARRLSANRQIRQREEVEAHRQELLRLGHLELKYMPKLELSFGFRSTEGHTAGERPQFLRQFSDERGVAQSRYKAAAASRGTYVKPSHQKHGSDDETKRKGVVSVLRETALDFQSADEDMGQVSTPSSSES